MTPLQRNLLIAALLTLLVLIVQLTAGTGIGLALLSAAIAFLLTLFVLRVSDRYGRR